MGICELLSYNMRMQSSVKSRVIKMKKIVITDVRHPLCWGWMLALFASKMENDLLSAFTFLVSGTFMLYHCGVLIPHLHPAHGLFISHSSPSSLMLLFVELNIENLLCVSTASIFHAMAWLGASQWNCADFRCIHRVNNNWHFAPVRQFCGWIQMCLLSHCFCTVSKTDAERWSCIVSVLGF